MCKHVFASSTPIRNACYICAFDYKYCSTHICKHALARATASPSQAPMTPFNKVMAANRGEIAIRIFRAGTELGLRTVSNDTQLKKHVGVVSCERVCKSLCVCVCVSVCVCACVHRYNKSHVPVSQLLSDTITSEYSYAHLHPHPHPPQVAVYSPADRLQPHRYKADEAYQVGTSSMAPVACYLDMNGGCPGYRTNTHIYTYTLQMSRLVFCRNLHVPPNVQTGIS